MNAVAESVPTMSAFAARWLAEPRKLLIDGHWVPAATGKLLEVLNPATAEVIGHVAEGDADDVHRAVMAARRAYESGPWSRMTPSARGKMVWRIGELIEKHAEELAELESLDNGKPYNIAKAVDVALAADIFYYMAGWTTKIHGQTIPLSVLYDPGAHYHSYTRPEPVGVIGQIIPWNFPLLMAAWKLSPALATGNTVILKVAEETPLSALRLAELIQEAGVPAGVVNVITGYGHTAGAAITAHPEVDKVAFTGSTEVGKIIVRAAADHLKKVTLELGGKSPNIVLADADLDVAIPGAANAVFFNHGQVCSAGSRLFVEEKVFDRVVEGVADFAKKIRLGSGLDPNTDMGPMVSQTQRDRVASFLEAGKAEGAEAVSGGRVRDGRGYFIEPTVFVKTNPNMKIVREEIFGPVITVMPFKGMDDALVHGANDTVYGLAAGIWTRDVSKAHALAAKLKAGSVWVNCYNIFDAALPFGGYKQSGWGREMGEAVLHHYTEMKAVTVRL